MVKLESTIPEEASNQDLDDRCFWLKSEGVEVSFDDGWQKYGSGRSFSSLSAHACMISNKTGNSCKKEKPSILRTCCIVQRTTKST